ncbi:MAG: hypothetical protein J6I60_04360 [Bacteroidaceae bacterium]|nr:hypothetical protein [Bacteroidaceae bacterium]
MLISVFYNPTQNTDVADVRQQLAYVAVSRATDTVIFIGDNVVKLQSLSIANLDLARALERISLQNIFDPTCQTEIVGAGQTQHGEFRLLLRQPYIKDAVEVTLQRRSSLPSPVSSATVESEDSSNC